ncbi:MAG: hypothetical protein GXY55_01155 [Phycisphaerae bacterium]|mgnify:CR=1 FL=1|nr:hypothetical protein [Phycisphaerae bacterium]
MKVLTTAETLTNTLRSLMDKYHQYRWSVAWASVGFDLYDKLLEKRDRIKKAIIGTHFYQTHPDVLKSLCDHPKVRFVPATSGVFHPKIYLFENSPKDWACIVGSPNFTRAAYSDNVEVAVMLDSSSVGADAQHRDLSNVLNRHWESATRLTRPQIDAYRAQWRKAHVHLKKIAGGKVQEGKGRRQPHTEIPPSLFTLSWDDFVSRVREERDGRGNSTLKVRLDVLADARTYFTKRRSFSAMTDTQRQHVAGCGPDPDRWGWFGGMGGAGYFTRAINSNNRHISNALDSIPMKGLVTTEVFNQYVKTFVKAFPNGGGGVGGATRLLSIKRPDVFVCLNSANRSGLCREFGISQLPMDFDRYWQEIIQRIQDSVWWRSPRPSGGEALAIWQGRTALLDALFYGW